MQDQEPESLVKIDKSNFNFSYFTIILKKWWLFLVVGLISAIAGIYYASIQKPQFESRLTFSLDAGSNLSSLSGAMNLAAQFGFGMGTGQNMFDGDNILEILKCRRIVEKVFLCIDTFNGKPTTLIEFYLKESGLKSALNNKKELKNISFPIGVTKEKLTYLQDSILYLAFTGFAKEELIVARPDKKLSIFEVRIISTNEKFAKIFTDRLVEETSFFYTEITSKKDRETLEILEQRVASLKNNVSQSIESKASTQDANVNPAFAQAQSPLLKQQYNMQAYGEAYKEMFKTLELARYQYLKKIPLLQIIDFADYPMKRTKQSKLKTALVFSVFTCLALLFILFVFSFIPEKIKTN